MGSVSKVNPKINVMSVTVVLSAIFIIGSMSWMVSIFVQASNNETQRLNELKDEYPNLSCEEMIQHVKEARDNYSILHSSLTKLNWLGWLRYAEYQGC